jgi:L,D-transpeptidase ErfK/SrfK
MHREPRRPVAVGATAFAARPPGAFRRVESVAATRTYLLLRLGERRVYLVTYDPEADAPAQVESFPVAIGRKEYGTPTGLFRVTDKIEDPDWVQFDWDDPSRVIRTVPPGPDNPLGPRWIGFASGYGWQIGFHGTPHPELLGQAVSHGCVRMRNDDVVKVYDRVEVGTVVIVQP